MSNVQTPLLFFLLAFSFTRFLSFLQQCNTPITFTSLLQQRAMEEIFPDIEPGQSLDRYIQTRLRPTEQEISRYLMLSS